LAGSDQGGGGVGDGREINMTENLRVSIVE